MDYLYRMREKESMLSPKSLGTEGMEGKFCVYNILINTEKWRQGESGADGLPGREVRRRGREQYEAAGQPVPSRIGDPGGGDPGSGRLRGGQRIPDGGRDHQLGPEHGAFLLQARG